MTQTTGFLSLAISWLTLGTLPLAVLIRWFSLQVSRVGVWIHFWCFQKLASHLLPAATLQPKQVLSTGREHIQKAQTDDVCTSLTPLAAIAEQLSPASHLVILRGCTKRPAKITGCSKGHLWEIVAFADIWKEISSFADFSLFVRSFLSG